MSRLHRWQTILASLFAAATLVACGGGGSGGAPAAPPVVPVAPEPGAPALTNNTSTDGLNWINYRRAQVGIPALTQNTTIDRAAQGHSEYQKTNNVVTHDQSAGAPGFTGVTLLQRLTAAGYVFANASYAYGEVISATSNNSGVYMAEELITAIYHRFVMFEPRFKEIGTGSATNASGYTYFTSNFTANNGYGPGIGRGNVVSWPTNGQTGVTRNFFSDYEAPDPVSDRNEVGYPISIHADIDVALVVNSFTVRPRGGAELSVKVLKRSTDVHTPQSVAAIVPLQVLSPATTYDVAFSGTADSVPVSKSWSFTTR